MRRDLDISVLYSAEDAIRDDAGLTDAGRAKLIGLLRETVIAAQRGDAATTADRLRQYLEVGANAATVIAWLGPLLTQLGVMLSQR